MNLRFFEIYRSYEYLELLAIGIFNSVIITTCAGIIGFSLGVLFAVLRYEKITVLGLICASYTDFVRNTPLIVQMFFVTFGLPQLLGYEWPFWAHAILALTLNFSAYFSEIVWAGLKTVNKGQIEAAKSMGLPRWKILWTILLPQAIAKMFPSLNAQFVFLF